MSPIDASIPLSIRPPQSEGPLEQFGRALSLRNMVQQGQMQSQQMQMQQMQMEQAQQQMQEIQALFEAVRENTGPDGTINDAGVMRSLSARGLGNKIIDYRTSLSKLSQEQLKQESERLKTTGEKLKMLGQYANGIRDQQTYQDTVFAAVQQGLIPKETLEQLPARFEEAKPIVQSWIDRSMSAGEAVTYQAKLAEEAHKARMNPLLERKAEAEATGAEQETTGTKPMTQYQRNQLEQQGKPNTAAELAVIASDPNKTAEERDIANKALKILERHAIASRPVNVSGSANPEINDALNTVAAALASGDPKQLVRLKDVTSLRGDQRLLAYARAKKLNPNFSPAEADRQMKMLDWAYNGQGANQIQSYNTFLEHAGAAVDAMESVNLYRSKAFNRPLNWIREHVGENPEYGAYLTAIEPVKKEFESFLLNNRALYAEDREAADRIMSENSPPSVMLASIKQMGHTAKARSNEINFRFKKVIGQDIEDLYSPEAARGAQRIGLDLGRLGGSVRPAQAGAPKPEQAKQGDPLGIR